MDVDAAPTLQERHDSENGKLQAYIRMGADQSVVAAQQALITGLPKLPKLKKPSTEPENAADCLKFLTAVKEYQAKQVAKAETEVQTAQLAYEAAHKTHQLALEAMQLAQAEQQAQVAAAQLQTDEAVAAMNAQTAAASTQAAGPGAAGQTAGLCAASQSSGSPAAGNEGMPKAFSDMMQTLTPSQLQEWFKSQGWTISREQRSEAVAQATATPAAATPQPLAPAVAAPSGTAAVAPKPVATAPAGVVQAPGTPMIQLVTGAAVSPSTRGRGRSRSSPYSPPRGELEEPEMDDDA
jgi:hypothetical protein